MHNLIFTGPTMSWLDVKNIANDNSLYKFDSINELLICKQLPENIMIVMPPVAGGDLYSLRNYDRPYSIGIIDGYFENRISVWHKEILYMLSKGVPVCGASSMGALRAAELHLYGMIGIGEIFHLFKNGHLEDDDEVTVCHGPAELGYPQVSEAMVNIRFTLKRALEEKIIKNDVHEGMSQMAKSTYYKKRNYGAVVRSCIEHLGMQETDFADFLLWLEKFRVDQKRLDAHMLVRYMQDSISRVHSDSRPSFMFEDTVLWRNSIRS